MSAIRAGGMRGAFALRPSSRSGKLRRLILFECDRPVDPFPESL